LTAKLLEDITYISNNSPIAAKRFGLRIASRVKNLSQNPYLGGFIAENREKIYRELIQGNYRVIYRTDGQYVHIISVRHAARLLDVDSLE
jgi:plasmid stabilization system protein ParE